MTCLLAAGVTGVVCLLLSIRLAHASLEHKLKARRVNHRAAENKNKTGKITKQVFSDHYENCPCNIQRF